MTTSPSFPLLAGIEGAAEATVLLHATGDPVGSEYDLIFTLTK